MQIALTAVLMLGLVASVGMPAGAAALEPGVHADPGSPAAKEYALPLSEARRTGGGQSAGSHGLFGAGIEPRGGHGYGNARTTAARRLATGAHVRHAARGKTHADARAADSGMGGGARGAPAAALAATHAHSDAGGSMLTLLGGGVAVLALGGIGGTVLRGKRSPGSSES